MFSESIRGTAFWTLDFLRGSKVKNHYLDIKNIMENNGCKGKQQGYLEDILKYATENVDFYRPYLSYSSLKDFPIINKNIIKNIYEQFQSIEYRNARVFNMHTSGSTGTPFIVRQDANKRNRVYAEMMYFWGKAGYQIGMRYVFFRVWTSINRKSIISARSRNIIMRDIIKMDEENLEKIRQTLKTDQKIKILLGYASTFENLVNYLNACGDTPDMYNIRAVISGAEALEETTREKLKKVFGVPVVSLYSNQENGMIAQECLENKEFHICSASYYVELLKFESDEPAEDGEEGRIVITDLFNHAMPLIRYETGDVGIMKAHSECGWNTPVFSSIQGRLIDYIYDTRGKKLSPYMIVVFMWPFDKILQFQFVQEAAKQYILKINGAEGHYRDDDFIDMFKKVLGQDADITVEHVDEVPVLKSGKQKKIVCNYKPETDMALIKDVYAG